MSKAAGVFALLIGLVIVAGLWYWQDLKAFVNCTEIVDEGFRPIADDRAQRFLGKVQENTFGCRGPEDALVYRDTPWVDWANYWATADESSRSAFDYTLLKRLGPNARGIDGALLDLEYQRIELLKFNLFDNNTYQDYVAGRNGIPGRSLRVWPAMRLPDTHPQYAAVGGEGEQLCTGSLVRHRTLTGICNDLRNPAMGSTRQVFARNVQFEETFPRLSDDELVRNRHGDRLDLLKPDPQVISRKLFTRDQSNPALCNDGAGLPGHDDDANCDYKKADFFNVLAAFWIQFMTHDWFSHLDEGRNSAETMKLGCTSQRVGDAEQPLTPEQVAELGCRPDDEMEYSLVAEDGPPPTFTHDGQTHLARAHKTFSNNVTAWWDASQIYGYDETSQQRVKRDPDDPARLLMNPGERAGSGEQQGYLPLFDEDDPINPAWAGQEAAAFPDNWTIGMSFYHNLFVREHNAFVDVFRARTAEMPDADSGLRDPADPERVIRYRDVTDEELFQIARLVVSAEIAKIHTIEWTTQLLYDEVLYEAMNSNWHGLFRDNDLMSRITERIVLTGLAESTNEDLSGQWFSVLASGSGIFGLGSGRGDYDVANLDHVNGGINHFGSPFNFPEEFITVYRLHPLVPDLIEYREWNNDPNAIQAKVPVVESFRGRASEMMQNRGLANWALSMGRQRLGALSLRNHARFLQNLRMERLRTPTQQIDVAALDLIRDRERGIPRFNEFRRQYGLRQLTSFDDFIDLRLPEDSPIRQEQAELVESMREIYGQHRCDTSKIITRSQLNPDGSPINDCLGRPHGSLVDNVEDLDTIVGWLAESTRPHGFAISETQFQVFIINASRRLFSDRFFTSSFRPEFYSTLGVEWVNNNGPDGKIYEPELSNGHREEVSPLKRVMLRTMPELEEELASVVNVFDPWARDRGSYYSLEWRPRPGAENDEAFMQARPETLQASAGSED